MDNQKTLIPIQGTNKVFQQLLNDSEVEQSMFGSEIKVASLKCIIYLKVSVIYNCCSILSKYFCNLVTVDIVYILYGKRTFIISKLAFCRFCRIWEPFSGKEVQIIFKTTTKLSLLNGSFYFGGYSRNAKYILSQVLMYGASFSILLWFSCYLSALF